MDKGKITQILLDWLEHLSDLQRMCLVLLAGAMSGFSFAPFYLFPLLAISYPLLLLVLFKSTCFSDAFSFGWLFGFGQFFVGTIWVASAFEVDDRFPGWVGYFAVGVLAAILALYAGLAAGLLWRLFRHKNLQKNSLPIVLSFVVFWNLAEWLRGHLFTGFPWNLSGYTWGFSDIMLQSSAIWGIYGLGLLTIFLACVPYLLIQMSAAPVPPQKSILAVIFASVFIIGGMVTYGMVQLSEPTVFHDDVKLKIIQANINQEDKWDRAKKSDNFIKYLEMSKSPPKQGITHVIWPETAVAYFLDIEPSRRYLIADMLNETSVLMTGFPRIKKQPALQAWNSFAVFDHMGNVSNIYDKHHLVPFGEYTPDIMKNSLSFLGLGMLVEGFSYSKGAGLQTFHQESMPSFGVLICYEIIFPGAVVDQNNRPDWLLNITNDAWYGSFNGPYQHLLQTRVRAIEEGLPVIRSAGTGVSAVIDAYGRVIKSLDLNKRGVIISGLPVKRESLTIYSQKSNWIFFIFMLLLYGLNILFQRQWSARA
ncbi:MAG: apolipoprotein N-acyltransferase [Emcibacter sp.]|nr:apolipoprotein N-acyltransferase [Emcibacter sp.]